jgi:adenylylsulfate kinase
MKILIMGLPGSGKSTLAEPFAKLIGGVWLNADAVRKEYDDWDFTPEGRIRQALRMKYLSDGVVKAGKVAIADFICPTEAARAEFSADFVVWMDTIKEGRFEDTNKIFQTPAHYDYHVSEWFTDTPVQLAKVVSKYLQVTNG